MYIYQVTRRPYARQKGCQKDRKEEASRDRRQADFGRVDGQARADGGGKRGFKGGFPVRGRRKIGFLTFFDFPRSHVLYWY